MTQQQIFQFFKKHLQNKFAERELNHLVRIYGEDKPIHTEEQILNDVTKLLNNQPIQYVTGLSYFYKYKFKVNSHVLIPRPETEELVDWIIKDHAKYNVSKSLIDIGTGSGIIPICIKKENPSWHVDALDVSEDALAVAEENAKLLEAKVQFYASDFLSESMPGMYDIIVSNPPYISMNEMDRMGESVVAHEPHIALFADDPLIFYKRMIEQGKNHLNPDGLVYLEINEFRKDELVELYQNCFGKLEFKKDLQGKYRMLKLSHPLS